MTIESYRIEIKNRNSEIKDSKRIVSELVTPYQNHRKENPVLGIF